MKAMIFSEAGNIDSIKTVELPNPEPKKNQVQISVKAVALSTSDFMSFSEKMETGRISLPTKIISAVNKPFGGDAASIPTGGIIALEACKKSKNQIRFHCIGVWCLWWCWVVYIANSKGNGSKCYCRL